jgi:acyl carrier protein
MNIAERVRLVLARVMMVDAGRLTDAALLADDLDASSLDRIELVMALEDEFHIEISENAAESIKTVGDIIRFVEAKAAPHPAA